jgi:hypothetical protein
MVEPRAPPQGCWNVRGRRFDGGLTYHGATSRLARRGACCSTAHYRRDDRAPAARELQLIREGRRREDCEAGWTAGACARCHPKISSGAYQFAARGPNACAVLAGLS